MPGDACGARSHRLLRGLRRRADGGLFYLCDPELTFHTGDSLVVDGGYTIF